MTTNKLLNKFTGNKFQVVCQEMPICCEMVKAVTFGDVELTPTEVGFRIQDDKIPGEKLTFNTVELEMTMDENWDAFAEIWSWMNSMATPDYDDAIATREVLLADIKVLLYTNAGNLVRTFTLQNCWPSSVTPFEVTTSDAMDTTFIVTFYYTNYTITPDTKNLTGLSGVAYNH